MLCKWQYFSYFPDIVYQNKYDDTDSSLIKRSLKSVLTNGKLVRISVLNAKENILKKINISFIVHFCFGK